jgi:hypothetical protein
MKIAATIARYLLGLMFLVFGSNMFLHFIPSGPMPPGQAGEFAALLMATHYMHVVGAIMVVSGILFLVNRYVPLGLILLAPVLVNILLFHILMAPKSIETGAFATLLWLLTAYRVRPAFRGLFQQRVQD